MAIVHIGVLLPTSSIFPMGKEFEKGLMVTLNKHTHEDVSIEITKEFIGQGGVKQTEEIINKLFNYHDVDLITGILSSRLAENVAAKFKNGKPLIVNNLGEFLPNTSLLNPYVFTNSLDLWKHAWGLGNWGVKTFGKKGMYISSVYDAGYSFSHLFYEGMKSADPDSEWSFSICPMPQNGELSDISVIFHFLEQYQPDFVFATFCGSETTLFVNEFIERGWHKKTKLLGLPYLLSPFEPVKDDITIYTTVPYTNDSSINAKNVFYNLGSQTAVAINEVILINEESVYGRLSGNKKNVSLNGTNFFQKDEERKLIITKNEITALATNFEQEVIATVDISPINSSKLMDEIKDSMIIGWTNPYMCV